MRTAFLALGLLGSALAIPRPAPQNIDLDGVLAAGDPEFVTPPVDVVSNTPTVLTTTSVAPIAAATSAAASDSPDKRDLEKRDGDCSTQPTGSGPVPVPDTVSAFLALPTFASMASQAATPYGYSLVATNLQGSMSASNYMGLHTLTSYNPALCQSYCDKAAGCVAFNIYFERDPTLNPNVNNCPNPASTTNIKCTLWGAPLSARQATNVGQYRDTFQVVITGSNVYNKNANPPAAPGYTGPVELGGAINAPDNSYMGFQFFPFSQTQGFTPDTTCAQACTSQTTYNIEHPNSDCTYAPCIFYNAYVLSKDGVAQGLYCSLYNATWTPNYGTNYGQYRGSDYYSVSDSYSYSLVNPPSQPAIGTGKTVQGVQCPLGS